MPLRMDNTNRSRRFDANGEYEISERTKLIESSGSLDTEDTKCYVDHKENQQQTRQPSRGRLCAVMTSCLVVQILAVGTGYGLAVMYVEIIDVFKTSRSEAALIQSIFLGFMVGGGAFWSWLINRLGPGPCIIGGAVTACVGFIISAYAVNVTIIIIFTGLVAGFGLSFGYLGTFITVSWVFHKDPGIPLVFLTVGSSIGQFVVPYLFEILITEYTWSGAFLIIGAVLLNSAVCGLVIYYSREYFVTGNDDTNRKKSCDPTLFKDAVLMNILFCSLLLAITGPAESWFLVDIMSLRGYTRDTGTFFVSMAGLANFTGRFVGAMLRIFSPIPTVYHWIYLCPILAVSHVLVTKLFDYWALFGDIFLYGTVFGVTVAQTPAIIFEASGLERYPQAIAMLNVCYGGGNFLGGLMGGAIKDATGSYDLMFYLATGASVFVAVATVTMLCTLKVTRSNRLVKTKADGPVKYSILKNEDDVESCPIRNQANGHVNQPRGNRFNRRSQT